MTDQPERSKPVGQQPGSEMMAPGDEAPPGTPGTGEDVCRLAPVAQGHQRWNLNSRRCSGLLQAIGQIRH